MMDQTQNQTHSATQALGGNKEAEASESKERM